MASPFDNSPCTVHEALDLGIPFLAARTGGIPELIAEDDHQHVLFEHSTASLANALRNAIEHGGRIAGPSVPQEDSRRSIAAMHANWRTFLPQAEAGDGKPLTVAAIVDHPAGARLDLTLDSFARCPSIHRFIILNRNGDRLTVKNIDLMNADAEAIESELAEIVEDAVLLIHSGVSLVHPAFNAMLLGMESARVDGLLPAGRIVSKNAQTGVPVPQNPGESHPTHVAKTLLSVPPGKIIPHLGGSAAFSLFEGVTFTGAMLIRRGSLSAARAGRPLAMESPFLGLADSCVANNERIWPYPEVVIERAEECRFEVKSFVPARVASYGDASSNDRYYMLSTGYGAANQARPIGYKRELALAAVNLGLAPLVRIGAWGWRRLRRWIR